MELVLKMCRPFNMNSTRLREISNHAEALLTPERITLSLKHEEDLRLARYQASRKHNAASLFPLEFECYVAHTKALILAKANCLAAAYRSFDEAAGPEAYKELLEFCSIVVAALKMNFEAHARLTSVRTNRSASQIPHLVGGFERATHVARLEGKRILDVQSVQMKNRPPQPTIHHTHSYRANGQRTDRHQRYR
jgi:hypothetical protein